MQELNNYFTASTSTSVVVDKSSDGEFLRIEFNFRYDLVTIITLLMYIWYLFYLFRSAFQSMVRTAVRAHITVCVEQLEIIQFFDWNGHHEILFVGTSLLISLNNHLVLGFCHENVLVTYFHTNPHLRSDSVWLALRNLNFAVIWISYEITVLSTIMRIFWLCF